MQNKNIALLFVIFLFISLSPFSFSQAVNSSVSILPTPVINVVFNYENNNLSISMNNAGNTALLVSYTVSLLNGDDKIVLDKDQFYSSFYKVNKELSYSISEYNLKEDLYTIIVETDCKYAQKDSFDYIGLISKVFDYNIFYSNQGQKIVLLATKQISEGNNVYQQVVVSNKTDKTQEVIIKDSLQGEQFEKIVLKPLESRQLNLNLSNISSSSIVLKAVSDQAYSESVKVSLPEKTVSSLSKLDVKVNNTASSAMSASSVKESGLQSPSGFATLSGNSFDLLILAMPILLVLSILIIFLFIRSSFKSLTEDQKHLITKVDVFTNENRELVKDYNERLVRLENDVKNLRYSNKKNF